MNRKLVPVITFVAGLVVGASGSVFGGTGVDTSEPADRLVTGIGGVFFKARSPEALRAWYRRHLGLDAGPNGVDFRWRERDDPSRTGRTVWNVFPHDTDYFGDSGQRFMVNYRVSDLDTVLAKLSEEGIHPVGGPEDYSYGRFAWIEDGEGNRIELWEAPRTPADE